MHAVCKEHSELTMHSGLQVGGEPNIPGQLHIGLWLITSHLASIPQVPAHGLAHLNLWQALVWEHSALTVHSGLQLGGVPIKASKQEHTAKLFASRHLLFGPHGDGWQGLPGFGGHPHSELRTHSGLQLGGVPIKSGKQEQAGLPPIIWHFELGPQGEGTHDGGRSVGSVAHSELTIHSGLQLGGWFMKPD
uniref:Uncharacterized protein n=1 Tax=Glossina austeni TaxID=7395 RepID=A0A1A9VW36_GLOAU